MHSEIVRNVHGKDNLTIFENPLIDYEPPDQESVIFCNRTSKTGLKLIMLCSTLEDRSE
jgi:hypothetical protein